MTTIIDDDSSSDDELCIDDMRARRPGKPHRPGLARERSSTEGSRRLSSSSSGSESDHTPARSKLGQQAATPAPAAPPVVVVEEASSSMVIEEVTVEVVQEVPKAERKLSGYEKTMLKRKELMEKKRQQQLAKRKSSSSSSTAVAAPWHIPRVEECLGGADALVKAEGGAPPSKGTGHGSVGKHAERTDLQRAMCDRRWADKAQHIDSECSITVAYAETLGRRMGMEDRLCVAACADGRAHVLLLCDGHGGAESSAFVCRRLPALLREELDAAWVAAVLAAAPVDAAAADLRKRTPPSAVDDALAAPLRRAFARCHDELEGAEVGGGATVLCAVLCERRALLFANLGDCRAVLVDDDEAVRATYDHKPEDPREVERVTERGGFVRNGRVCGMLAVSRSLGDTALKKAVSSEPEVLGPYAAPQRVVMACDGVWDVLSEETVGAICGAVAADAGEYMSADERVAVIVRDCAYACGSGDNISVVVWSR